jgi:hypothetical protein
VDSESPISTTAVNDDHIPEGASEAGKDRLEELLIDAERRSAQIPELDLRIADLEYELATARRETAVARREAWELDQMLMYGRRLLRHVRPLIEPLRNARRRLRS